MIPHGLQERSPQWVAMCHPTSFHNSCISNRQKSNDVDILQVNIISDVKYVPYWTHFCLLYWFSYYIEIQDSVLLRTAVLQDTVTTVLVYYHNRHGNDHHHQKHHQHQQQLLLLLLIQLNTNTNAPNEKSINNTSPTVLALSVYYNHHYTDTKLIAAIIVIARTCHHHTFTDILNIHTLCWTLSLANH